MIDYNQFENMFYAARKRIMESGRHQAGIGTLGEKTLHAVLKYTFEPDDSKHEVKVGRYHADIVNEDGIIEIQTRNFNVLRNKLTFFLETHVVTIVYPIAGTKWLIWLDNETGEVTKKRKSPKTGKIYDAFYEFYKIRQFLTHPNIRLCIAFLDITEYRNLDGWSHDKKRGSSRYERIPENPADIIYISNLRDYGKLLPDDLQNNFTSRDFMKTSGLNLHQSQTALNVLKYTGTVIPVAKQANAIVYCRN